MTNSEKLNKALKLLEEIHENCFKDEVPTHKGADAFKSLISDSIFCLKAIEIDGFYDEFLECVDSSHPYYAMLKQEQKDMNEEYLKKNRI
jgi:hypothetical protein